MSTTEQQSQIRASGIGYTILALALVPSVLGLILGRWLTAARIAEPMEFIDVWMASLQLYVAQDITHAVAFGILPLAAWWAAKHVPELRLPEVGTGSLLMLALASAGATIAISLLVFQSYLMTLDEIMAAFQAEIFRAGRLFAPLDRDAISVIDHLQSGFTFIDPARGLWASDYRPIHAFLLALTPEFAGINLLNAALTAVSILALADILRRVVPDRPEAPWIGAFLFIASPQVLITAGSGFSYTTHLAFSLIWLALFLRPGWGAHVLAALLGVAAIGIHQVHIHPLFVAPFLAAMLLGAIGKRSYLVVYAVAYGLALPGWILWHEIALWLQTGDVSVLPSSIMEIRYIASYFRYGEVTSTSDERLDLFLLMTNLLRFALWLSPALVLLIATAVLRPLRLGLVPGLAATSAVLVIVASHVLMPNQTQSWGARYFHPIIGNLVIVAVAAYGKARDENWGRQLGQSCVLLLAASLFVLLPWRGLQVAEKVHPRAEVQRQIQAIPADVVIMPLLNAWFLSDFMRNDPFLENRPLLAFRADSDEFARFGTRVHVVTNEDLDRFGLPQGTLYEPGFR